jgi:hypothetical protein
MNPPDHTAPQVEPTGDGERSTAGSNYGDWRPLGRRPPHGYDFEKRFVPPSQDPDFQDKAPWPHPAAPSPR